MAEKIGISLDKETLKLCDKYAAQHSRPRSEFIATASQKHVSDLELGKQKNIIAEDLPERLSRAAKRALLKYQKGFSDMRLRLK